MQIVPLFPPPLQAKEKKKKRAFKTGDREKGELNFRASSSQVTSF